MPSSGVPPRVMGIGPVPATQKLLARLGLSIDQFDVIELNEAFASQSLAVLRGLGVPDDAAQVNPNGGAIALGHPLGMSGARLVQALVHQLDARGGRYGLARSEEHTSELQSLMRISYAVFCLKKNKLYQHRARIQSQHN